MKLPKSYNNVLSYTGTVIAATNILLILFLSIFPYFNDEYQNPYIGLYTYIVLPMFLVIGMILIPIGMYIKRKKRRKLENNEDNVILDLNNLRHRGAFTIFLIGTGLFLIYVSVCSYKAYHYTESLDFCGRLCHTVMKPEWTAYQNLSHSKVSCAECHIGSGADWYVKSKFDGLYQVYRVMSGTFPRPIPPAITNLRPARETCENCHWPEKFYPNILASEKHYLSDKKNTEWNIQLKMKIGPEHSSLALQEGIHWHINPDVKVEYISSSSDKEVLPWVRYINTATGDTIVFENTEEPLADELRTNAPREMDCIDCHNRPSHKFFTPQDFIDNAISAGDIPQSLPEIKNITMQIFSENVFTNTDTAKQIIENSILNFYKENYADIFSNQKKLINKAIQGTLIGFQKNIFPEMNASWDSYPDNIGHIEFNGCFRCHAGNHKSKSGKIISRDCNKCHSILAQGISDSLEYAPAGGSLEFRHPIDIGGAWKESKCSDCHRYLY